MPKRKRTIRENHFDGDACDDCGEANKGFCWCTANAQVGESDQSFAARCAEHTRRKSFITTQAEGDTCDDCGERNKGFCWCTANVKVGESDRSFAARCAEHKHCTGQLDEKQTWRRVYIKVGIPECQVVVQPGYMESFQCITENNVLANELLHNTHGHADTVRAAMRVIVQLGSMSRM